MTYNKMFLLIAIFILFLCFLYTKEHLVIANTTYTPINISGFTRYDNKDGLTIDQVKLKRNTGENLSDFLGRCKDTCNQMANRKGFIIDIDNTSSNIDGTITTCWIKGTMNPILSTLINNNARVTYLKN